MIRFLSKCSPHLDLRQCKKRSFWVVAKCLALTIAQRGTTISVGSTRRTYWNDLDDEAATEERRLFYVGMTRAKDRLLISRATERQWRGRVQTLSASRFLNDIERELTKHQRTPEMRRKPEHAQLSLLL
jgi:ATP-dependent exoDNAse (exonuclease V) beta subunit